MCYRRWGHNELDEPAFTQPLMYNNIRLRTSVPKLYEQKLLEEKVFESESSMMDIREKRRQMLDTELQKADNYTPSKSYHLQGKWKGMIHMKARHVKEPITGVEEATLREIGKCSVTSPVPIKLHPRLQKYHIDARLKRLEKGEGLDWATAEALAFGSLMKEGHGVRISGQDVGRGTFSQRHAMFVCQETEKTVIPLNHLGDGQQYLEVSWYDHRKPATISQ